MTTIAARLRRVCGHMAPAEFDAMVRTIAERADRWDRGTIDPQRGRGSGTTEPR